MDALRRCCQVGVCLICRSLLGAVIILGGVLTLLEYSFTDLDVTSMPTDVDDVPLQWLTMSTTSPQVEQTLTWSNSYEPNMQTTAGFRMSLTVDVTIDSDGSMAFAVVNEQEFSAAGFETR